MPDNDQKNSEKIREYKMKQPIRNSQTIFTPNVDQVFSVLRAPQASKHAPFSTKV
jgi:hypothetical protein